MYYCLQYSKSPRFHKDSICIYYCLLFGKSLQCSLITTNSLFRLFGIDSILLTIEADTVDFENTAGYVNCASAAVETRIRRADIVHFKSGRHGCCVSRVSIRLILIRSSGSCDHRGVGHSHRAACHSRRCVC